MSKISDVHSAGSSGDAIMEVAHELRAPLGGIESMAELLRQTDLTADQLKLVQGLQAAAAHMRAVANDVLSETAATRQIAVISEKSFHLRDLVQSVGVSAEARAKVKNLAFVCVFDAALPEQLVGDARRIRQMLENLLDNAIKVTATGSVTLQVEHVDRRGAFEGLKFTVLDTGPGFGPDEQKKLFRSFGRLENGVPGTGLGLSLVRRFARAMGGEAGCEAVIGEGARFWFSLRLKVYGDQQATPQYECAGVNEPVAQSLQGKILIVDDNAANRMIMTAILEHFGYTCAEVDSGEKALEMVQSEAFAAVMLDQTLPGMSGVETLSAIRAMPAPLNTMMVIPVTGRVSAADRKAFAEAGANGFVEKPVTARAVRDAILGAVTHHPETKKAAA
ncbi:MAG: response regulator [Beijerinckiaceae bacterium]